MSYTNKLNYKIVQLKEFVEKKHRTILVILIITYIAVFSLFCLYKYLCFNYIGLDLAIFNQTLFNSSQGNLFGLTIHPHSYLGDHFALILPILLPFYYFLKSPAALLILQSIILALSAWPLFLIARKKLSPSLSLFISLLYLINVFVHNINAYEFHIIPLAIFFLFFSFYFYLDNKFGLFALFLALSLLVREDVALVILMFGLIALIEKRKWCWSVVPLFLGLGWFIFAMKMTGAISGYGQYKFIAYYGWLGKDIKTIILGIINHPWPVIKHVFSWENISFFLGLFVPFAFLPLLKPKYLLLPLLIFIQIIFLSTAGALALEIHYTSLFIPFLFISFIYVLGKIFYKENKNKFFNLLKRNRGVFLTILFLVSIYSALVIGPSFYFLKDILNYPDLKEEVSLRNYFIEQIPSSESVATGFHFIPHLSSREKIYSLSYQYLGHKQYSDEEYEIPEETEFLLFDYSDFLYYQFLYREFDENNIAGATRIRNLVEQNNYNLIIYIDDFLLYQKEGQAIEVSPYRKLEEFPEDINLIEKNYWPIRLKGMSSGEVKNVLLGEKNYNILPLTLYWESLEETKFDYQIKVTFLNSENGYEKNYPLSAFYPTHDWKRGDKIKVNYQLLIPQQIKKDFQVKITIYRPSGRMGLDKNKVFRPFITNIENLGEIELLWITL